MQHLRFTLLSLITCLCLFSTQAQQIAEINVAQEISEKSSWYTDGYVRKVTGKDITYNNQWDNQDQAFLTRTTTGQQDISWETAPTKIAPDGKAHYLHIIALDQGNKSKRFHVYLNDKKVGSFINFHEKTNQTKFTNGIQLDFQRYAQNEVKDGGFFLDIQVPSKLVTKGKSVIWKIVGEHANANNWFMVFCNSNLTKTVQRRANNDLYFELNVEDYQVKITAPLPYSKRHMLLSVNGKRPKNFIFQAKGETAQLTYKSKTKIESLELLQGKKSLLNIPSLSNYKDAIILKDTLLCQQQRKGNQLIYKECYSSATAQMQTNTYTWWNDAKTYIMVSSHQDIAWMDTPYRCEEMRDKYIVTPALELLKKYPDYSYNLEQSLIVQEYIKRNPRRLAEMQQYVKEGRLSIGASYTQPYEEMQQGESLVRQFYHGKRYLSKIFPGFEAKTYWNVDVPGRTLQMPQILAKCGIKGIQYSRHERGTYRWFSPDSSNVLVFTPGHYGVASQFLRKVPELGVDKYSEYMNSLVDYRDSKEAPAVVGLLSAEDMSEAHAYYNWKDMFDTYSQHSGKKVPQLKHTTSDEFFEALEKADATYPSLVGERPEIWMYIHGPSHERALTTYREAYRNLITAETYSTIASKLSDKFNYPERQLFNAWEDIIFADHGWGGKRGNVTDSLFHARYRHADTLATEMNQSALAYIAGKIKIKSKKGTPVVIFNSLSQATSYPVELTLDASKAKAKALQVINAAGEKQAYQLTTEEDGTTKLHFIANNIPSVGYSTYIIKESKKSSKSKAYKAYKANESRYYTLKFNQTGHLIQIYDNELNQPLFDTQSNFNVGDVFTLESVGNGAGEFDDIQQANTNGMEQSKEGWKLKENGDVYSLYESETTFKEAKVVRQIKLYKQHKRIDFPCHVLGFDGTPYREFRMAFPLIGKNQVSYDVPFGTVQVGKDEIKGIAGERYLADNPSIHPRSLNHWIGGTNSKVAVKLTSSVVVADYINPCKESKGKTVLQPILFASRKSCHWLGEQYTQEGDHHFLFSLRSDAPSDEKSAQLAIAANYKPYVVYAPEQYVNQTLPQELSFFSVDKNNIRISAIKRHEDNQNIVVRLFETDRKATSVQLKSFFQLKGIQHTNMLENHPEDLKLAAPLKVGKAAIETYQLLLK